MRTLIAFCLVPLLAGQDFGQASARPIREQLAQVPEGKGLKVKLQSGATWEGKVTSLGQDSFDLQPNKSTSLSFKQPAPFSIKYQDVQSVRRSSHKKAWIITGAVVGGVAATLAIVCTARQYSCYDQ